MPWRLEVFLFSCFPLCTKFNLKQRKEIQSTMRITDSHRWYHTHTHTHTSASSFPSIHFLRFKLAQKTRTIMGASAIFMLVRTIIKMKNDKIKLLNSIERKKKRFACVARIFTSSFTCCGSRKKALQPNEFSSGRENKRNYFNTYYIPID